MKISDFIKNNYCFVIVFCVIFLRFVSLGLYELYDTTEARYAGIGMRMAQTGNWITPMIYPDVPFLAKPPLSFWITAVSFKIFGYNEFAARLPHLLGSTLLLCFVFVAIRQFYHRKFAEFVTVIFATMVGFMAMSGMVMTEACLLSSTVVSIISFWVVLEKNASKKWSYIFFASLGLSMLAKGPVGIILACAPMFLYVLINNKWKELFQRFSMVGGILVFLAISLPWYILISIKNPEFIEYFFVGEHIKRFLEPGWSGDLYGNAHMEPIGMIWIMTLGLTLPWVIYLPPLFFRKKPKSGRN